MTLDFFYDVIIGGGGNAALVAAITACERNKKVLLLTKDPYEQRGGHTRYTECFIFAHDEGWHGLKGYSESEYLSDIKKASKGANLELAEYVVKNSRKAADFVETHGIRWQEDYLLRQGGSYFKQKISKQIRLEIVGGGTGLVNHYYHYLENLNKEKGSCKVLYDAEIVKINVENKRFKSVEVIIKKSDKKTFYGNNLILATGGFESNFELLKKIFGNKFDYLIFRGEKMNTGLPLFEMIKNGAATVGKLTDLETHPIVDARMPKVDGGVCARARCIPYSIVVNKNVERIFDEGNYAGGLTEVTYTKLLLEQPEGRAYAIFDSSSLGKLGKRQASPFIEDYTIEGLAKKINIDPDKLLKVINDFNLSIKVQGGYTVGIDPPKSRNAFPIVNPPFYACPLAPGFSFTRYGLKVDKTSRVLTEKGDPFENIFAAGTIMVGNILSEDQYLDCLGLLNGTVFGMTAGENI